MPELSVLSVDVIWHVGLAIWTCSWMWEGGSGGAFPNCRNHAHDRSRYFGHSCSQSATQDQAPGLPEMPEGQTPEPLEEDSLSSHGGSMVQQLTFPQ